MKEDMRILHFAPKDCLPVNTGAKLRNYYFARELAARARVTYLSFAENQTANQPHALPKDQTFAPLESFCEQVITLPQAKRYTIGKLLRGLFGRYPLTVLNYTDAAMAQRLKALLDETDFDVVQVESLLLAAYLPIIRAAKNRPLVICDWHNIDSEVMQRYSQRTPFWARKLYARLTARSMKELESRFLEKFDGHFVVSDRDRAKLLKISPDSPVFTADNGVDCDFYSDESLRKAHARWRRQNPQTNQPNQTEFATTSSQTLSTVVRRHRILFVGSMDYHANVDAVVTFSKAIWPAISRQFPQLVFTIVGRNPSEEIRALANFSNIEVTGTVEDVRPFYTEAVAAVVPLRVGGGSRLKILEAMAAGVPVVSTRLGAEGLEIKDKETVLLAETGEDFNRSLFDLIANEDFRQAILQTARSWARERYDWATIGKRLFTSFELLVNGGEKVYPSGNTFSSEALEVSL